MKELFARPSNIFLRDGVFILKLIATVLYVISPVDVLPEAVLGPIGLVDDFGVSFGAFSMVLNHVLGILRNRNQARLRAQ